MKYSFISVPFQMGNVRHFVDGHSSAFVQGSKTERISLVVSSIPIILEVPFRIPYRKMAVDKRKMRLLSFMITSISYLDSQGSITPSSGPPINTN